MENKAFYFGIPLRCKASSNDWENICLLFNRTLWSVYNQTNPDFKIIVACHEIPPLTKDYDNRLEFIEVDIPFPKNLDEQMSDKGYKLHSIGKRIREYGSGFTMIVDADDLVSRNIVDFVTKNRKNDFGWYVKNGYILYHDTGKFHYAPKFPSGSNAIINYTTDALPENMNDAYTPSSPENKYIIIMGHSTEVKKQACAKIGRPLKPLPFRAAVYVLGTGDNHSTLNGRRSKIRSIIDAFLSTEITKEIRDEFSIDWM